MGTENELSTHTDDAIWATKDKEFWPRKIEICQTFKSCRRDHKNSFSVDEVATVVAKRPKDSLFPFNAFTQIFFS